MLKEKRRNGECWQNEEMSEQRKNPQKTHKQSTQLKLSTKFARFLTFDVFDISQVVKQYLKNSKDLDKDYYF